MEDLLNENCKYDAITKKVIKEITNAKNKHALCYTSLCLGPAY